ncbi:hypothetical protein COH44_12900 [Neisseria meningitidis]|nr:hypothetical protein COH44_12900 [Neisseria meningitidis]
MDIEMNDHIVQIIRRFGLGRIFFYSYSNCRLDTSDAADEEERGEDGGGRRREEKKEKRKR